MCADVLILFTSAASSTEPLRRWASSSPERQSEQLRHMGCKGGIVTFMHAANAARHDYVCAAVAREAEVKVRSRR
jgi:hypothetical protein